MQISGPEKQTHLPSKTDAAGKLSNAQKHFWMDLSTNSETRMITTPSRAFSVQGEQKHPGDVFINDANIQVETTFLTQMIGLKLRT